MNKKLILALSVVGLCSNVQAFFGEQTIDKQQEAERRLERASEEAMILSEQAERARAEAERARAVVEQVRAEVERITEFAKEAEASHDETEEATERGMQYGGYE